MKPLSMRILLASVFSSTMLLGAYGVMHRTPVNWPLFLLLLLITAVASRLKVRLFPLAASMSVNLPFLLIACARLNILESMCIAYIAAALQSIPRNRNGRNLLQAGYNASVMSIAAGLSSLVFVDGAAAIGAEAGPILV